MRKARRCSWAEGSPLMERYHDTEWGVPQHDDRRLFELLTLEGAQAGLSWETVLRKREGYRAAFAGFDPRRVARFGRRDVARLLKDSSIVRNRLKIQATIANAKAFLDVQREHGSFARYLWGFAGERQRRQGIRLASRVPAQTAASEALSRDLRRRGFRFVGPTIVYAYMQAVGLVNDHLVGCFRSPKRRKKRPGN